jgi:hypothetical protein
MNNYQQNQPPISRGMAALHVAQQLVNAENAAKAADDRDQPDSSRATVDITWTRPRWNPWSDQPRGPCTTCGRSHTFAFDLVNQVLLQNALEFGGGRADEAAYRCLLAAAAAARMAWTTLQSAYEGRLLPISVVDSGKVTWVPIAKRLTVSEITEYRAARDRIVATTPAAAQPVGTVSERERQLIALAMDAGFGGPLPKGQAEKVYEWVETVRTWHTTLIQVFDGLLLPVVSGDGRTISMRHCQDLSKDDQNEYRDTRNELLEMFVEG